MAAPSTPQASLDVYGLRIALGGDWLDVIEAVRLDFAWFQCSGPGTPAVEVAVERRPPDFGALGDLRAAFVTPGGTVYRDGGRTIVDHLGRALSVEDHDSGRLVVQGEDEHVVQEAVYYFLLGRAGEHLDARGSPRLHGLGLSGGGVATVVLLPPGGGKSTLALQALRDDRVRLFSDDSPLIDRQGRLHPFPLRIGVGLTETALLPPGHERRIERRLRHPKVALEVEAFADRVESVPRPLRHVVIGARSPAGRSVLEPLPRWAAVRPLLREGVVGAGLYQGLGSVFQRGLRETVGKLGTAAGRAACCAAGLAGATVWRLMLGRDSEENWAALSPLLR